MFFSKHVSPALLLLQPITFCEKCDKLILEELEISANEFNECSSIQYGICCAWFHCSCQNFKKEDYELLVDLDWICYMCSMSTLC